MPRNRLWLLRLGYEADLATNGLEAVDAMRETSYDVIFMDCMMPKLDGYAATQAIRGVLGNDRVRIVAMTANAMEGDRERCLDCGMDDYLTNPVDLDRLRLALEPLRGPSRATA